MSTNITAEHRRAFDALASGQYSNFALVSTTFEGEPTAAIAVVTEDGDEFVITPIAVFLTGDMFARLTDPGEGLDEPPAQELIIV